MSEHTKIALAVATCWLMAGGIFGWGARYYYDSDKGPDTPAPSVTVSYPSIPLDEPYFQYVTPNQPASFCGPMKPVFNIPKGNCLSVQLDGNKSK